MVSAGLGVVLTDWPDPARETRELCHRYTVKYPGLESYGFSCRIIVTGSNNIFEFIAQKAISTQACDYFLKYYLVIAEHHKSGFSNNDAYASASCIEWHTHKPAPDIN